MIGCLGNWPNLTVYINKGSEVQTLVHPSVRLSIPLFYIKFKCSLLSTKNPRLIVSNEGSLATRLRQKKTKKIDPTSF
jgi:hypothetical protein